MTTTIVALIIFLFPLAYSPGPGNMFFAANGARFGLRATLPANAGYHFATWIVTAAIGFGAIAALATYPSIFHGLKIAGCIYVLWLAWLLFSSGGHTATGQAKPAGFGSGVLLLLLNPKAYVIITLMFTQFVTLDHANHWQMVILITTVFTLNNMVAFLAWTAIGDRLAARFRNEESARRTNRVFGAILACVALWMAVT
jgi:threonine/homoserine/homoserine lactone efflux protein